MYKRTEIAINIKCKRVQDNFREFQKVCRPSWQLQEVVIHKWGKIAPVVEDCPETWPFSAEFVDENGSFIVVHIFNLAIGHSSESADTCASILDLIGVDYHKEDLESPYTRHLILLYTL